MQHGYIGALLTNYPAPPPPLLTALPTNPHHTHPQDYLGSPHHYYTPDLVWVDITVTSLLEIQPSPTEEQSQPLDLTSQSWSSISPLWENKDSVLLPSVNFPDIVPQQEVLAYRGNINQVITNKPDSCKKMETMFLVSILLLTIFTLYLFPPPD